MRIWRARSIVVLSAAAGAALLGFGALTPEHRDVSATTQALSARNAGATTERVSARNMRTITADAMRLYADGEFPAACERFVRAATEDPENPALRETTGHCFERWGWKALRERHPSEAMVLFQQGLRHARGEPGLLKGLGVAAVQAGHPDAAFAPLEEVVRIDDDAQARLLLAHLYDRRDDITRSMSHVRAILSRDPAHVAARRLLEKLERERDVEARFHRDVTPHFIVKSSAAVSGDRYRSVVSLLESAWEHTAIELGFRPGERLTVVLYPRSDFEAVTGHDWAGGAFDGKIRLPVGPIEPSLRDLQRLIRHEYAHAAIHELTRGRAPRWLHEGLAQLLAGVAVDPMLRVPGNPTLRGIEMLVTDSDPLRARTGYDLTLWIVQDLVDRGGLDGVRRLLSDLGRGEELDPIALRIYGLRLTELESEWRRLLGG